MWVPGLQVLRPMPGFFSASTANIYLPSCSHDLRKNTFHSSGTVGAFCASAHCKGVSVLVLTGSECKLMPFEFVAKRFVTKPHVVVYDCACATLKSALVRLPYVARLAPVTCDRFHWRYNHIDCSCAMNPESYVSMDGVNRSSSEELNALSHQHQHHLR